MSLVAYQCLSCGMLHYPPHDRCLNCRQRNFVEVPLKGQVTLLTYTTVYHLPPGWDRSFLRMGIVEFENGVRALGQIRADSAIQLQIGMRLQANWGPVRRQGDRVLLGLILEPLEK